MSSLIVEIVKIDEIHTLENADKMEMAVIKGWNVLVQKNKYKVNDKAIFIPPDSIVPDNIIEEYNLLYLKNNNRIRTVKLRGYISQGVIIDIPVKMEKYKIGTNVASELGITKWQPLEPDYQACGGLGFPTHKKRNPLFDKYTDLENIKNFQNVFKEGEMVIILEKLHGCNARYSTLPIYPLNFFDKIKKILFNGYEFVYGSRNVQITTKNKKGIFYGEDVYGRIAKKYDLKNKIPKDYIVYGEIYGKGIQDLTYGLNDIDFAVFDIKYKGKYLNWDDVLWFCIARDIPTVPVFYRGEYNENVLRKFTSGNSHLYPSQIREGCVIKPVQEQTDYNLGRKIVKSINIDYLIRQNGTEFN